MTNVQKRRDGDDEELSEESAEEDDWLYVTRFIITLMLLDPTLDFDCPFVSFSIRVFVLRSADV